MKGKQAKRAKRRHTLAAAERAAADAAQQDTLRARLSAAQERQASASARLVDASAGLPAVETMMADLRADTRRVEQVEERVRRERAAVQAVAAALLRILSKPRHPDGDEALLAADGIEALVTLRDEGLIRLGGEDAHLARHKFQAKASPSILAAAQVGDRFWLGMGASMVKIGDDKWLIEWSRRGGGQAVATTVDVVEHYAPALGSVSPLRDRDAEARIAELVAEVADSPHDDRYDFDGQTDTT